MSRWISLINVKDSAPHTYATLKCREGGKERSQLLTASQLGREEGNKKEREKWRGQGWRKRQISLGKNAVFEILWQYFRNTY
jgi:hypothetical protein